MPDDGWLRSLYAEGDPDTHPDERVWEALALGEIDTERRSELIKHAIECSSCARVLRGIRALEEEGRKLETSKRTWWWLVVPAAAAAAIVLSMSFSGFFPVIAPSAIPPTDVRSDRDASRPEPLEPVGALSGPPSVLRWRSAPETRAFRVEVLDAAGTLLWKSDAISDTSCPWPSEVAAGPGRFYWRAIAFDEDGESIASPMVAFDVPGP